MRHYESGTIGLNINNTGDTHMIKIMDKLLGVTMLAGMLLFLGVQPSHAYPLLANVSAYAEHGAMANGEWTHEGAVAADDLPFGTHVIINGREYVVKDRFGGGYSNAIDIWMPSYDEAIEFGRQYLTVEVLL